MPAPLRKAVLLWKNGDNISLDLWAKLTAMGFDVPALERRYMI